METLRYSAGRIYGYLPTKIIDNGQEFTYHKCYQSDVHLEMLSLAKRGYLVRKIQVLPKSLRNKIDVNGRKYQPQTHIFIKKRDS